MEKFEETQIPQAPTDVPALEPEVESAENKINKINAEIKKIEMEIDDKQTELTQLKKRSECLARGEKIEWKVWQDATWAQVTAVIERFNKDLKEGEKNGGYQQTMS